MPYPYIYHVYADQTILTAALLNADQQNHVDNNAPDSINDYMATVTQMRLQTDPGAVGTESQALTLAQELERLRFCLARLSGTTYWYEAPIAAPGQGIVYSKGTEILSCTNNAARLQAVTAIPTGYRLKHVVAKVVTAPGTTHGLTGWSLGDTIGQGNEVRWANNQSLALNTQNTPASYALDGQGNSQQPIATTSSYITLAAIGGLFDATGQFQVSWYMETAGL